MDMNNKLSDFLKLATPEQREQFASACNTSVGYLYQIAGKHSTNISLALAIRLASASRASNLADNRLQVITIDDLIALNQ